MNPTKNEQMIVLYWHCLDMKECDERFLANTLEQLCQFLRTEPTRLAVTSRRLKDEHKLVKKVDIILHKIRNQPDEFERGALDIVKVLPTAAHLLVYCMPCSGIAKAAVRFNNEAEWGITHPYCFTSNSFAAVYKRGNKFVVWHEALHLLGANDCSDCHSAECCDSAHDIMQHIPMPENVRNWPFLCGNNITLIQRKVEYLTRV